MLAEKLAEKKESLEQPSEVKVKFKEFNFVGQKEYLIINANSEQPILSTHQVASCYAVSSLSSN